MAGPTRRAIRDAYHLPQQPTCYGDGADPMTDCLIHTTPCVACFGHCQESNELRYRGITPAAPLAPKPFDWAVAMPDAAAPATAAPKPVEEMKT